MLMSYAQNAEDIVLNRAFKDVKEGFYIDVGAADPVEYSVTKFFYDKGWCGVNIEPQEDYYTMLKTERPRDINLNIGIANSKETRTFYKLPKIKGWSSFDPAIAEKSPELEVIKKQVKVAPLSEIVEKHIPKDKIVHFLKVDVEGYEQQVLESVDLKVFRPIIIVIEITHGTLWEKMLKDSDYILALKDGINHFYVRKEDKEIAKAIELPANCRDNFRRYGYEKRIAKLEREIKRLKN